MLSGSSSVYGRMECLRLVIALRRQSRRSLHVLHSFRTQDVPRCTANVRQRISREHRTSCLDLSVFASLAACLGFLVRSPGWHGAV